MTQPGLRRSLSRIARTLLVAAGVNLVVAGGLVADEFSRSMQTLLRVEQDYGHYASQRVNNWYQLINDYRDEHPRDQLELVNNFFNQLAFINDTDHWGEVMCWCLMSVSWRKRASRPSARCMITTRLYAR